MNSLSVTIEPTAFRYEFIARRLRAVEPFPVEVSQPRLKAHIDALAVALGLTADQFVNAVLWSIRIHSATEQLGRVHGGLTGACLAAAAHAAETPSPADRSDGNHGHNLLPTRAASE